jgi:hypothetical protein
MIKNYCIEVHLNGITSLPNIMKIYQAVQKLLLRGHTGRQTEWWFDKPTFIFFGKQANEVALLS